MQTKSNHILLASVNAIGFLAMIFVNYLANALPINGKTTGALSDQYPNLFVPAGFTFAIWGIIYLFLLGFVAYQYIILTKKNNPSASIIKNIHFLFVLNALGNVGWIYAWHYEMLWVSMIIMLLILATLIMIYRKVHLGMIPSTRWDKFLIWIPFSIYLGWISIATIANMTALLVVLPWSQHIFNPSIMTILMIAIGIILASVMLLRHQDPIYGLVVIWALYGIYANRINDVASADGSIEMCALIGIIWLAVAITIRIFQKRTYLS